ncbi:hypothetical protein BO70DRAFT_326999 [Aspergillus heteromorphus CBS 117.55]|uniref:Uncharacterized protein n=1 Tax=Aspergillus heteromorphus CBS 117.55 TaxID=1448321 RepID=A0A317X6A8_9EURO|nr:uncharacterized protein BO70DRAFT_326999 [Aspergillus heteromorphus CBS 117.55]PWY92100.1 hypothetical protein BO70DRAFT_326999 [Aspergillus heteromorphus CBS 117.55]
MAPSPTPSPAARTPGSRPSLEITPDFIDKSFDPVEYLNDVLPPLTLASTQTNLSRGSTGAVPLPELSTQVQSVLSQINAQNVRHSNTLTQLTDEILRGGGRLAYEVEVLRGETIGLSDTLTEALQGDIAKFVPEDVDNGQIKEEAGDDQEEKEQQQEGKVIQDPEYITKLRTLNQVRARLEEVVQTFGDAMEWPLPPSETSIASSFISVSAPDPGPENQSREEKGQEVAKKLRTQVTELLDSNGGGQEGIQAATSHVESLRILATMWRGTAEEKARNRFVDSLVKIVDDRRKALETQGRADQFQQPAGSFTKGPSAGHRRQESEGPGGGIFRNLQRLREEIYLE